MSGLIQSLEILNLPEYGDDTNWKVGDKIDTEGGKNIMVIGPNGSGKSTMLKILHESIIRASEVLKHPGRKGFSKQEIQKKNPFQYFSCLAGHVLSIDWEDQAIGLGMSEDEIDENRNNELSDKFLESIHAIYGHGLINVFDYKIRSTYHQAVYFLREYKSAHQLGDNFGVVDTAEPEDFLKVARKYASENGIHEEVMYGNIISLCSGVHHFTRFDNVSYGWVKPSGNEDKILGANRITLDNSEPNGESLGERSKRIVQELMKVKIDTLGLLDEPTNGVDMKSHESHVKDIMNLPEQVQVVASTHDPQLFRAVQESEDWIVHDLGEKR